MNNDESRKKIPKAIPVKGLTQEQVEQNLRIPYGSATRREFSQEEAKEIERLTNERYTPTYIARLMALDDAAVATYVSNYQESLPREEVQ